MGLVQLIESYGIRLRKNGKELVGLCLFHNDRHPSFNVNDEKQKWHCFGCQAGGDTISFVMKMENIGFTAAKKRLGIERIKPHPRPEVEWAKKASARAERILQELNQKLTIAEELRWAEEIRRLKREYAIIQTLADDLANPRFICDLFRERDWVKNVLGGEDEMV
jgi:hypothetical protein